MSLLYSIILGLIQGLTEFLPVSSSGHLVLLHNLFGTADAGDTNLFFDVLLHLGTLVSICVVYKNDIIDMIKGFLSLGREKKNPGVNMPGRMAFLIIIACVPLLLVYPFKDWLEEIRSIPWLVGIALIITGLLLFVSDRWRKGKKNERSASWADALIVGFMQAIAVIPGISRSGSTISMGLFRGFNRKFAINFSFLMSLPAVLAATIVSAADAIKTGIEWSFIPYYIVGFCVSAVTGFFAIKLVKALSDKGKFGVFAYYCWFIGVITIISSIVPK